MDGIISRARQQGVPELFGGIGFTVIAVGLFAVAEIVMNLEPRLARRGR